MLVDTMPDIQFCLLQGLHMEQASIFSHIQALPSKQQHRPKITLVGPISYLDSSPQNGPVDSSFSWPASLPVAHPPPGWLVWLPTSCQFPTAFGSSITAGLSCTLPGELPGTNVDYWRKSPQFWGNDYYQLRFLLGNVSACLCGSITHHYPLHILW